MDRREFNRGIVAALIGIPAARLLAACGSSEAGSSTVVVDLANGVASGPTVDGSSPGLVDLGAGPIDLAHAASNDLAMVSPPDLAVSTITYTSTIDSMHTHQVTLETSLYASPPAGGDSRMTTVSLNHSHKVTLTQAQLIAISHGTVLTVPTGVTNGHSHCFHFTNHP
jgi:hypothetical protein